VAISIADLPKENLFGQGNAGCGGCGAAIAGRQAMKALGSRTIVTVPASCMATLGGSNLKTTWRIPFYHTLFEMAPAVSSGIRAALEAQGIEDVNVVSWAGDAGSADIGFQALSGAAERNEHIIHVCYDNEMYMNTGGQTGSQTPMYAITSNMAKGKTIKKKNMLAIMEAHGLDYVASASIAYPLDLIGKFKKAAEKPGFSYIHILAPCHRGWQIPPEKTIEPMLILHETYQSSVLDRLHQHYSGGVLVIVNKDWPLVAEFWSTDLSYITTLLQDQYAAKGPEPRDPASMLRSYLLFLMTKHEIGITEWVNEMKRIPYYAILSGFDTGDCSG